MRILSERFREHRRPFVYQSTLATLTILLILLFLDVLSHTAIIATLGSSAFLVFARPQAYSSRPRPLLGGYAIGIVVGVAFYYLSLLPTMAGFPIATHTTYIVFSAMAVGVAIFLMLVTCTEHPPAAGMALGLVMNVWDVRTLAFIFSAVLFMAAVRRLLQRFMIDLFD